MTESLSLALPSISIPSQCVPSQNIPIISPPFFHQTHIVGFEAEQTFDRVRSYRGTTIVESTSPDAARPSLCIKPGTLEPTDEMKSRIPEKSRQFGRAVPFAPVSFAPVPQIPGVELTRTSRAAQGIVTEKSPHTIMSVQSLLTIGTQPAILAFDLRLTTLRRAADLATFRSKRVRSRLYFGFEHLLGRG